MLRYEGKVYLQRRFLQYVFLQYVFLQKCNFATGIFAITKNTHCNITLSNPIIFQHGVSSCLKLRTLIYLKSVIDEVNVKWILSLKITKINSWNLFKCEMLKAQSMLLCCRLNSIIHLL